MTTNFRVLVEVEFLRYRSCGRRVLMEVELAQVEFRWREAETGTHVNT